MKKILILIIGIGLIFGLVGIGTQAYFSDVETSNVNIFTAGTWENLKVTAVDATTQDYIVTVTIDPSTIATVTSENYTVSAGGTTTETITNVPFGTAKATFLATLTKGETNQTWADTGIADTVVTGNTLAVTAQDGTTVVTYTVTVNAAPVVLTSIAITTSATKLIYILGDSLDITGLVVTGTYSDDSTAPVTISASDVSGFNSSTPVTGQILTITVGGKTATYTIDVVEAAPSSTLPSTEQSKTTDTVTTETTQPLNTTEPDKTPPVITLKGDNPIKVELGSTYIDAGATATDNIDGDITSSIKVDESTVNTATPGSYKVTYNVSDKAGNTATEVIRTVIVNEQSEEG